MSHLDREALAQLDVPWLPPARVILTGLGITALGWLSCVMVRLNPAIGIILVVVGLLVIGIGLATHLSAPRPALENPFLTSLWWLLGAAAAFVGSLALEESADSMSDLLNLAALAAVFAALLSAVPRAYRLVGISLLIGWHFFAIFTATQIIGGTAGPSWLASQVWTRVTRPYLQITHLNNAYHFYAPEPGPVAVVWFRVRFADGAVVWERLPNHAKCPNHVERRRMAGIASTLGQSMPGQPSEEQIRLRDEAAQRYAPPLPPRPQGMPLDLQYRDPGPLGKMMIESMARYFARTTTHPNGEKVPVVAVKIYRGECSNPRVEDFQAGRDPLDPTLFRAWYLGEYDPQGKLTEASSHDMLYWLIPILRVRDNTPSPDGPIGKGRSRAEQEPWDGGGKIVNYLRIHAGDGNKEDMP
jgi:hypothetical protein